MSYNPLISQGFVDIFIFVLQYMWMIILLMGVAIWAAMRMLLRRIIPVVEYHRKGGSLETFRCLETQGRLEFYDIQSMFGKKGNKLAITIEAKPETLVKGSNTYRVHHVVEGCSSTVDPRAASDVSPSKTTGIGVATSISTMGQAFETMGKGYPTAKSAVLLIVVIGFMCFLIGLLLGVSPLIKK